MNTLVIETAESYRDRVIQLLKLENLPVADLPETLNNFFVAVDGVNVVGVIGLEIFNSFGLLRSLAVASSQRSQGVAAQLVSNLEQYASTKGIENLYLLTETAPDYFKRKGFNTISRQDVPQVVQQSTEFSYVCPQSAIVMVKNIKI